MLWIHPFRFSGRCTKKKHTHTIATAGIFRIESIFYGSKVLRCWCPANKKKKNKTQTRCSRVGMSGEWEFIFGIAIHRCIENEWHDAGPFLFRFFFSFSVRKKGLFCCCLHLFSELFMNFSSFISVSFDRQFTSNLLAQYFSKIDNIRTALNKWTNEKKNRR